MNTNADDWLERQQQEENNDVIHIPTHTPPPDIMIRSTQQQQQQATSNTSTHSGIKCNNDDIKQKGIDSAAMAIINTAPAVTAQQKGQFLTPDGLEITSKNTLQSFDDHPAVQQQHNQNNSNIKGITIPTTSRAVVEGGIHNNNNNVVVQAEVIQSYDVVDAEPYYSVVRTQHSAPPPSQSEAIDNDRVAAIVEQERKEASKRIQRLRTYGIVGGIALILIFVIVILVVVLLFVLGSSKDDGQSAAVITPSKSPVTTTLAPAPTSFVSPVNPPTSTSTTEPIETAPPTSSTIQVACDFLSFTTIAECQSASSFDTSKGSIVSGTSIPTEIGLLTRWTHLVIESSGLSGSIPTNISELSRLTYLGLFNNQLNGPIPSTLNRLTLLEYLGLDNNALTSTIPTTISDLSRLTDLNFSRNQLTGSIPSTLNRLTSLEFLFLYDNIGLMGTISSETCSNTLFGRSNYVFVNCDNDNIICTCCSDLSTLELCM